MTVIGILFGKDSWMIRVSRGHPTDLLSYLGTCVRYLRFVETSIDARGPDFLGGSATVMTKQPMALTSNGDRIASGFYNVFTNSAGPY